MRYLRIWATAALLAGCADDGRQDTRLQGRAVESAGVTAYRVSADGTLDAVGASAATGLDGRYEIVVAADVVVDGDLVVKATQAGAEVGAVMVGATAVAAGGDVAVAPIDAETTAEAALFVAARVSGEWPEGDGTAAAQLRLLVTPELATSLESEGAVSASAHALATAVTTWSAMLAEASVGVAQAQLDAAATAVAAAQAELDAALDAADSEVAVEAAVQAYADAFVDAYADAGVSAEQLAMAGQATADALVVTSVQLSAAARAELAVAVEQLKARLATTAIETRAAAAGLSAEAQQAIAGAGVTLRGRIDASAEAIAGAWAEYRAAVEAQLAASLADVASAWADTSEAIAAGAAQLRAAIDSVSFALPAGTAATLIVAASAAYYADAAGEASVGTLIAAGLSSDRAGAVIDVIALLYGCGR